MLLVMLSVFLFISSAHGFRQLSITHLTSSLQLIRRTETIVPLPFDMFHSLAYVSFKACLSLIRLDLFFSKTYD